MRCLLSRRVNVVDVPATLDSLYRNHGKYVSGVAHVTNDNVRDGYLLEEDGELIKEDAGESSVGR